MKIIRLLLLLLLVFVIGNTAGTAAEQKESGRESALTWHGTRQVGTSNDAAARGIAVNLSTGDVYVTGATSGSLDGNKNIGKRDAFLMKYDASGNKQWVRQFGTAEWDVANNIAFDQRTGAIYIAGETRGSFAENKNAGGNDIFFVKFNSSGVVQWTRQFGTAEDDIANDVAVNSSTGAIYVTGYTLGGLDGNKNAGRGVELFLMKYDASGNKQWIRQLGATAGVVAESIAVDPKTNAIYLTGFTFGSFDKNTNSSGDEIVADIFLVKYDASGNKQWVRQLGTAREDKAHGVAVDPNTGAIYITGETFGSLDGNANAGKFDIFLVKYDASGNKQWVRQLGTEGNDYSRSVAVDNSTGFVYITGSTGGSLDGNKNAGVSDIFLVKYDASGNKQWVRQIGTAGTDMASGIVVDSSRDAIYIIGRTWVSLDGKKNTGDFETFLVKYNTSGVKQWDTH